MKSSGHAVGNVNLRGKKTGILSCGCCGIEDLREKYNKKLAMKEMNDERNDYKMSEM